MTDSNNNDGVLKELANRYTRAEGVLLSKERERLPVYETPGLDRRVRHLTVLKGKSRFSYITYIAAAACVALALLISPFISKVLKNGNNAVKEPEERLIPITFTLTNSFVVTQEGLDRGESVYFLKNIKKDDVVMTLKKTSGPVETEGLTAIRLNGQTAYTRETDAYKLLVLQSDGILYTLSCRYELDTLLELGKNIL